jgi:hypothetical protein
MHKVCEKKLLKLVILPKNRRWHSSARGAKLAEKSLKNFSLLGVLELGFVPTPQNMDGIAHRTVFAHELLCFTVVGELARVNVRIVILDIDDGEFNFKHRI